MAETDTRIQEESTSPSNDRENLDRLLKIFNGGTGVNLGVIIYTSFFSLLTVLWFSNLYLVNYESLVILRFDD